MKKTKLYKNKVMLQARPNPKMGCKKGVCIQCVDSAQCKRRQMLEPIFERSEE